jgi:hypothetical protein
MRGLNRVIATLELDIAGTTYRYSPMGAAAFDGVGMHRPFVSSMGPFPSAGNFSEFALETPAPSVEIYDHDRTIQKLVGGSARESIVGSPARCYRRASPSIVATGSHWKFFDGIVSAFGISGERTYRFDLSPDMRLLDTEPKIPRLTRDDFPTAPLNIVGTPLWIVFGAHLSTGVTDARGMIQCLPSTEDSSGNCVDWVISYGQATGVVRLFRGASQSAAIEDTANWGFYTLERGGRRYQMGHYNPGSNKPLASDYVAVDMYGLFQDGPVALTSPITNPAECIRVFLGHFVYGAGNVTSAQTAYENETTKPIASSVFDDAETYFATRGDKCAMVIRADEISREVFNEWCNTFNAGPFLEDAWKIGAIPEDEADTTIYFDDRHVIQTLIGAEPVTMDNSRNVGVSSLTVNHLFADSLGRLTDSRKVEDPEAAISAPETYDLTYGKAEAI